MIKCQLDEFMAKELDLSFVKKETLAYIENTITSNIKAFTFANKSLVDLTIYVVIEHTGKATLFKAVKGKVVRTKLDKDYADSRGLVGLEAWNVEKVFKISFGNRGSVDYISLTFKQLKAVLQDIIEPNSIQYTLKLKDNDTEYHTLKVDKDLIQGLNYRDLLVVIKKAYKMGLGLLEQVGDLDIYLVDYSNKN